EMARAGHPRSLLEQRLALGDGGLELLARHRLRLLRLSGLAQPPELLQRILGEGGRLFVAAEARPDPRRLALARLRDLRLDEALGLGGLAGAIEGADGLVGLAGPLPGTRGIGELLGALVEARHVLPAL